MILVHALALMLWRKRRKMYDIFVLLEWCVVPVGLR